MKVVIPNGFVGLLFKKQILKTVLDSGEYNYFSNNFQVTIIDKRFPIESYAIKTKTLKNKHLLENLVTEVNVLENQVGLHFVDSLFSDLLEPGTYTFFKDSFEHKFSVINTDNYDVTNVIPNSVFQSIRFIEENRVKKIFQSVLIDEGTVGILKVEGKFTKKLEPGKYYFIIRNTSIEVKSISLKNSLINISGQELLTKDKVNLRLNFVATYKVNEAVKVALEFDNHSEQLYTLFQLALRQFVSTKTLDELLLEKHEIGKVILEEIRQKEEAFGINLIEAGLKDIILPGDIKEILNTILIAEKKALANIITRREETASTRSLLNTAKLMEENTTLYKLKELEYLERIADKVGNISLSSSGGILEQLHEIIKVSK